MCAADAAGAAGAAAHQPPPSPRPQHQPPGGKPKMPSVKPPSAEHVQLARHVAEMQQQVAELSLTRTRTRTRTRTPTLTPSLTPTLTPTLTLIRGAGRAHPRKLNPLPRSSSPHCGSPEGAADRRPAVLPSLRDGVCCRNIYAPTERGRRCAFMCYAAYARIYAVAVIVGLGCH